MIISIRGTNGAGKSTLVRSIMDCFGTRIAMRYPPDEKKRVPMGYILRSKDDTRSLLVTGHYETVNGGIDTMPSLVYAYDLALKHHELACDVIMEGKNFTESPAWILSLHKRKFDIRVVLLDVPVEQAIQSVRARGHKIQERTIRDLHNRSRLQFTKFENHGVKSFKGNRRQCLEEVKRWLGI
jgi:thymidylate kinase